MMLSCRWTGLCRSDRSTFSSEMESSEEGEEEVAVFVVLSNVVSGLLSLGTCKQLLSVSVELLR